MLRINFLNREVASDVILLTFIRAADLCLPLLVIPFVIRALTPSLYGVFATVLAVFNYLLVAIDFGLNASFAKRIAAEDAGGESNFVNCIYAKGFIFIVIAVCAFSLLPFLSEVYRVTALIMLAALCAEVINPVAYYQGRRQLKSYAIITFLFRLVSFALVVLIIKKPADLNMYTAIYAVTPFICNAWLLSKIKDLKRSSGKVLFSVIYREGWHIFSYRVLSGLVLPLNMVLINAYSGPEISAAFSVVQRVASACTRLFEPVNTALFPHFARLHKDSGRDLGRYHKEFNRLTILITLLLSVAVVILIVAGPLLQKAFFGHVFDSSLQLAYKLIMLSVLLNAINPIFVSNFIIIGKSNRIKYITSVSMIFSMAYSGILAAFNIVNPTSIAVSILIASFLSTVGCLLLSPKNRSQLASGA